MSANQRWELLKGMLDCNHPLNILERNIWKRIWDEVDDWYARHIEVSNLAYEIMKPWWNEGEIRFPEPTGIEINMMPIKLFDLRNSLPSYLWGYKHMIESCYSPYWDYDRKDTSKGWKNDEKIVYLTVQESRVSIGETQRRAGLHIERPLVLKSGGESIERPNPWVRWSYYHCLRWGMGKMVSFKPANGNIPIGGIYMASNLTDSCEVYPALIKDPVEFTDKHGGIEHARLRIKNGRKLKKNELCWITDETPHESLPVQATESLGKDKFVQRSFFRLVVGDVSVWYSKHNTPNPYGVQPDCPIVNDDKFLNEKVCEFPLV